MARGRCVRVLPYSRLGTPPGDAIALEPTEILALAREQIRALTRECYEITTSWSVRCRSRATFHFKRIA